LARQLLNRILFASLRHVNRSLPEIGVRCIQIGSRASRRHMIFATFARFAAALLRNKNAHRLTVLHKTVA